ncbi:MAG: nitroreductase family protein [Treponema sp.]|jgi:nitroreductase|nr:nitroreductase family protein [Treponema sp.]
MKKTLFCGGLLLCSLALGAQEGKAALDVMLKNYGERNYAAEPVAKADLDLIVQAGLRAPSAMNKQPWHFTVVQDAALKGKVISGAEKGGAIIVISAKDDTNPRVTLDCALAAENVYLAAQALGYGSRIYTGPVSDVNKKHKAALGLPSGYNAVILVRIGVLAKAGTDALSGASPRNAAKDMVTYK